MVQEAVSKGNICRDSEIQRPCLCLLFKIIYSSLYAVDHLLTIFFLLRNPGILKSISTWTAYLLL